MGTSLSRNNNISTKLYTWSGPEFLREYALIYTSSGRVFPARSCTYYYSVNPDRVLLTIDDRLCIANSVRVNMEFVTVRDSNGGFKFGTVKFEDSGQSFKKRNRRASKSQVLLFKYADGYDYRYNQLGVHRKNKKEYQIQFYTGISAEGGPSHSHNIRIYCDPVKGIDVELSGPYRHSSAKVEEKDICDTDKISGMPPDDVINTANETRKELKIEDGDASVRLPQTNSFMSIGGVQGNLNGSIINGNVRLSLSQQQKATIV